MTEQTASKVPQIRFKGFEGEWEITTLATACNFLTGNPFESKKFSNSGVFLVRGVNVKRGYLDNSARISEYWPTSSGLENFLLKEDDIVIQMDGALIGKSYAKIIKEHLPALLVQRVTRVRCENKAVSDFLYQYVQRDFLSYIQKSKTETAVPHLSLDDIRNFSIAISSPTEQTQIGGYFRELDSLIGLHQRKHDKLVTLKKAMLQKMFPQPGATTPEIRFKGYSGDWVTKKLGDLCDLFTDGDWIESKDQSASGIRLLQTGNVGINAFIDKADKARWISLDTFERLKCEEVFDGDILISRLPEPAGRACIVPKLSHRAITAVDCTIVRTSKSCDPAFLVQHCSLDSYFETVNNYLGGGTRQRISRSVLGKFFIQTPKFEEQQKIGTYFRTLDELISKHTIQLQKLQQIKSACLEKMFV